MPDSKSGGWRGWGAHVLKELEYNREDHAELFKRTTNLKVEVGKLQMKAALIGACAGCILTIATGLVVWFLTK